MQLGTEIGKMARKLFTGFSKSRPLDASTQRTEWQRIGNQIDAAMILSGRPRRYGCASDIGERIVNQSLLAPPDRDDRCAEVVRVGNMMN